MMSKFNKERGDLIASGGHSTIVTVWNADDPQQTVAKFDHSEVESPDFVCKEIEWQNSRTLAVSG